MLVECPECKKNVSNNADPCPHCGFPGAGKYSYKGAMLRSIAPFEVNDSDVPCNKCWREYYSKKEQYEAKKLLPTTTYRDVEERGTGIGFTVCVYFKCLKCWDVWKRELY